MEQSQPPAATFLELLHARWEATYAHSYVDDRLQSDDPTRAISIHEAKMLRRVILYQQPTTAREALIIATHVSHMVEVGIATHVAADDEDTRALDEGMNSLIAFLADGAGVVDEPPTVADAVATARDRGQRP